jgi:hypothetical protein
VPDTHAETRGPRPRTVPPGAVHGSAGGLYASGEAGRLDGVQTRTAGSCPTARPAGRALL